MMQNKLNPVLVGVAGEYLVADYVKSSHAEWLSGKQSNGKPRKDSKIRNFQDLENKYLEAWNLIKL